MADHLQEISEDENFRQGDIIRRSAPTADAAEFQWGFILNADCDIEQRRNSNLISWMEIISASRFIERYWASEQLEKLTKKQTGPICDQLNALIKAKNIKSRSLDVQDLVQWLKDDGADAVVAGIDVKDETLKGKIQAIDEALRLERNGDGLSVLLKCAGVFSSKASKTLDDAQRSLEQPGGFADHVFVPGIPGSTSEGFVVRLRDISGAPEGEVFRSELLAKINDQPNAFYRVGRFSDGLRYQIVQKMAFLFSRIGSPSAFEDDCRAAAQLLVDQKKMESVND